VTLEQLLPFEKDSEEEVTLTDYLYEPSSPEVFEVLLEKHLGVQMLRILNESAASEHGARMTAMDSATNNAGEMVDSLTLQYNRARQDTITTELIEVVSGAEAI
jgi:F-type H+-transporting ATPase subunit gamma